MDHQQQFCLKWNSFGSNLATAFGNLFKSESLADVTLFCEGVTFKAHRLILAACSKHFQDLFEGAPLSPSVLVILDGTSSSNMAALLEFMYKGEVHVSQEHLSSFLKAAECLQVKGLSIEHEKLAMVQGQQQQQQQHQQIQQQQQQQLQSRGSPPSHENPQDSPTGRAKSKLHPNGPSKEGVENGPSGAETSACYPSVLPSYMHPPHYRPSYEPRTGFDCPRKRLRIGSPSDLADTVQRASVLRDPRDPPKSPLSFPYRPSPEPQLLPRELAASNTAASAAAAVTFDRTAAADADNHSKVSADSRHSDSSRPEDLRIKMEPSSWNDEVLSNAKSYMEKSADKAPDMIQIGSIWDASAVSKTIKAATPSDGKKLKCPFCERLYGYETNLRAHIRQRHQGIRVPCPFCSRTFTRNNTVRRHIAREHKTELNMKAFHANPVHNHAQ